MTSRADSVKTGDPSNPPPRHPERSLHGVGGEPTTHKSRPPVQEPLPHDIMVALSERQVVWRAIARETHETEWPGGPAHADITAVDAFCGNDPIKEREER